MLTFISVPDNHPQLMLQGFASALSMDAMLWLETYVGEHAASVIGLSKEPTKYGWAISNFVFGDCVTFVFSDTAKASLFKLTWL